MSNLEKEKAIKEALEKQLPTLLGNEKEFCLAQIKEQQKRIDFLSQNAAVAEKSTMKTSYSSSNIHAHDKSSSYLYLNPLSKSTPNVNKPVRQVEIQNTLQYLQDTPHTQEKLKFLFYKVQTRLDSEQLLKYGFEKFISASANQDAKEKLEQVNSKIFILQRMLSTLQPEDEIWEIVYKKQSISGKLSMKILEITGVPTRNKKKHVMVTIDNNERRDLKLKQNKLFELHKSYDIEICFMEQERIIAFQWFPLSEVTEKRELTLDLMPMGQIKLQFQFEKEIQTEKLERKKQVQKYHIKIGHKFQQKKNFQILKCAVCQDFALGSAMECQGCDLVCHRKCMDSLIHKCIAKLANEVEENDIEMKHKIPHLFKRANQKLRVQWCCHCGKILPLMRTYLECTECKFAAHDDCVPKVPQLCSLPKDLLEHLQEFKKQQNLSTAPKSNTTLKHSSWSLSYLNLKKPASISIGNEEPTLKSEVPTVVPATVRQESLAPMKPSGKTVGLDDFTFLAVLGKGNFGKVMLAQEKQSNMYFGIKVLKKEFILEHDEVESTRNEKDCFLVANKESHPFLVNLHSCFQTESRLYFVMEYIAGGDLMYHIQQKKFTQSQALYYACEILLALEYLHSNNILYRDLKLDNILLTTKGHVKLADYGLCKVGMNFGIFTNTFCGTPEFMAPEILEERPYTRAIDWWSFGVLIYEMMLGKAPFNGDNEELIFQAIMKKQPIYPPSLPPNSVDIMQKLLHKDPKERLGGGPDDADPIRKHPYFSEIIWEDVYLQKNPPPFVPELVSPIDLRNFDAEFTSEVPVLTPVTGVLSRAAQDEFRGFTHVSDWAKKIRAKSIE